MSRTNSTYWSPDDTDSNKANRREKGTMIKSLTFSYKLNGIEPSVTYQKLFWQELWKYETLHSSFVLRSRCPLRQIWHNGSFQNQKVPSTC